MCRGRRGLTDTSVQVLKWCPFGEIHSPDRRSAVRPTVLEACPSYSLMERHSSDLRPSRGGTLTAVVLLVGTLFLSGCAFYSFSGASIPSHLDTIAIPIAEDNTTNPVGSMDRNLTDLLTDAFVGRTRLSLDNTESDADILLATRITRYTNQPTGVSGDERATTNSVTIRVDVQYLDQVQDSTMVDQVFTGSAEYDPTQSGLSGEEEAARLALERVSEDIFNSTTSDW